MAVETLSYSRPVSLFPSNDEDRLQKLYNYEILDTPAEEAFDKIALLACQIFDTPSGFVTFVDKDRVFLKSNLSTLEENSILREHSLCSMAILDDELTIFNDTHKIPDLLSSPYVSSEGGIRFYAGAPLKTAEGHHLGTVCVVDSKPREATEKQMKMLETLSSLVIDELENRLAARKAIRAQSDLLNFTVHDLKNPATTILLAAQVLSKEASDNEFLTEMANTVENSAERILAQINDLMFLSRVENGEFTLKKQPAYLSEVLEVARYNFQLLAQQKKQKLHLSVESEEEVEIDRKRIQDVFENLISNAIKYAYPGTDIHITLKLVPGKMIAAVTDQGQGLNEDDKKRLFTKFARLSAKPTGKERSNGLGLSIVKTLVELHRGSVWAESEGKDRGASFVVELPLCSA
ncbi:MAG: ATP-binding protein [Owenweeksia sp.]